MRPLLFSIILAISTFAMPAWAGSKQDWKDCPNIQNTDRAIAACTRIIKRCGEGRKNTGFAYNNRCAVYNNIGKYDDAIRDCTKALKFIPNNASSFRNRGFARYKKRQYKQAIADYSQVIKLEPKNSNSLFLRGLARKDTGDNDGAIADYTAVLKLDPKNSGAHNNRGNSYLALGQTDPALKDFDKALKIDPGNKYAMVNLGRAYMNNREHNRAIAYYDMAIRLDSKFIYAFKKRAEAHLAKDDTNGAIADLNIAVQLNPKDADTYWQLANIYRKKKQNYRAITNLDMVIRLAPKFGHAYYNRAIAFKNMGQDDKALKDFATAMKFDSKYSSAFAKMAEVIMTKGDSDHTTTDLEKSIQLNPADVSLYWQLAKIYEKQKQNGRAIANLDMVIRLAPKFGHAYYNRAITYMNIDQDDKALKDYATAMELDPVLEKVKGGLLKASKEVRRFDKIIEKIYPTIVTIDVQRNNSLDPSSKVGIGFIWSPEGLIVTSSSVLDDAEKIVIKTASGEEFGAEAVGRDKRTNLAVLRVEKGNSFRHAKLSDEQLHAGDWVLVSGSPFFHSSPMVPGIVYAKNSNALPGTDKGFQIQEFVARHRDLGPVFNPRGEVVGMLMGYYVHNPPSIKSAIPADIISGVVSQLVKYGEVRRGWLGVQIMTVTQAIADTLGLDEPNGALVSDVVLEGPAAKAQIIPGDVILFVDGQATNIVRDLSRIVGDIPAGKEVEVVVFRKGERITLKVLVGLLEGDDNSVATRNESESTRSGVRTVLGLTIGELTEQLREVESIDKNVAGALILAVDEKSRAHQKNIKAGEIVIEVAQVAVKNAHDVFNRIEELTAEKRKNALFMISDKTGNMRFEVLPIKQ